MKVSGDRVCLCDDLPLPRSLLYRRNSSGGVHLTCVGTHGGGVAGRVEATSQKHRGESMTLMTETIASHRWPL